MEGEERKLDAIQTGVGGSTKGAEEAEATLVYSLSSRAITKTAEVRDLENNPTQLPISLDTTHPF